MKIERKKTMCTGVGVASVKTALDLDSEMSSVKVIAGATDDEFEKRYKQAIQLGTETLLSASEAADDIASFARAGCNALANLKSALNDVQEVEE